MMNESKTICEFPLAVRFPVAVWFQGVLDFKISLVQDLGNLFPALSRVFLLFYIFS